MSTIQNEAPEFVKNSGRVKSEQRLALEAMEVGQWYVEDQDYVGDDEGIKKALANARTKTSGITNDPEFAGRKYSVRRTKDSRVAIGRLQ